MIHEETCFGFNYILRVRQLERAGNRIRKVACGETNACWIISYDEPELNPTQTQLLPLPEAQTPEGLP